MNAVAVGFDFSAISLLLYSLVNRRDPGGVTSRGWKGLQGALDGAGGRWSSEVPPERRFTPIDVSTENPAADARLLML